MKGKKWSPAERYKRAQGYARANGLPTPVWTDHKETELLRLHAEGKSYKEIAGLLGVSKRAAKTRVRYIALGRRNKRERPVAEPLQHLSAEAIRLEKIRQIQERAWFAVGYSRDEIVAMFRGWPVVLGHQHYEWTVGESPH